jgi:hypothetical protein
MFAATKKDALLFARAAVLALPLFACQTDPSVDSVPVLPWDSTDTATYSLATEPAADQAKAVLPTDALKAAKPELLFALSKELPDKSAIVVDATFDKGVPRAAHRATYASGCCG